MFEEVEEEIFYLLPTHCYYFIYGGELSVYFKTEKDGDHFSPSLFITLTNITQSACWSEISFFLKKKAQSMCDLRFC